MSPSSLGPHLPIVERDDHLHRHEVTEVRLEPFVVVDDFGIFVEQLEQLDGGFDSRQSGGEEGHHQQPEGHTQRYCADNESADMPHEDVGNRKPSRFLAPQRIHFDFLFLDRKAMEERSGAT